MLQDIITTITSWVTGFQTLVINVVTGMVPIFYTAGVGEAPGQLTLIGVLALMSVAIGLIYLGLRFILQFFPGAHQL